MVVLACLALGCTGPATNGSGGDGGSSGGGGIPYVCDEIGCECQNMNTCELDFGDSDNIRLDCFRFGETCSVSCGDACEISCSNGDRVEGVCAVSCGANCNVVCGAVAHCIVETGRDSNVTCREGTERSCAAELGDESVARCGGVTDACAIRCLGTCEVFCDLGDACDVECVNEDRQDCGEGHIACGPECPQ